MTNIVDELVAQPTRRDRWGRYLILTPEGKVTGYTRATTIAKTLDDGGGLLNWKSRMVALGLSKRPDLIALVGGTDDNDRRELDAICERAAEAGGATIRRDLGTALHAALEDSWWDVTKAPEIFRADVEAVHEALAAAGLGAMPSMSERIVANDTYQVAGTFDLVLIGEDGEMYVADIKTGSSIAYGALAFSIQLALYATADSLYTQGPAKDGSEDVREAMPPLNQDRGVILHVEPYSGKCELHWIDLTVGREALDVAMKVRELRKVKPLSPVERKRTEEEAIEIVLEAFPGAERVPMVDDEWREWMRNRIAAVIEAGHKADLLERWPADVPTLASGKPMTRAQGQQLADVLAAVERDRGLPFADPAPGQASAPALPAWLAVIDTEADDEGGRVPREEVQRISAEAKALPPTALKFVKETLAEAKAAGTPLHLSGPGGRATAKRAMVMETLVTISTKGLDPSPLLNEATGENLTADSMGAALGSLTVNEAKRLLTAALAA